MQVQNVIVAELIIGPSTPLADVLLAITSSPPLHGLKVAPVILRQQQLIKYDNTNDSVSRGECGSEDESIAWNDGEERLRRYQTR